MGGSLGSALLALDYQTGKVRWRRPLATNAASPAGGPLGLLSTAGGLVVGNDGGANFVAYEAGRGKPLSHAGPDANTSNGPQTFLLDGLQHVVVGAGDSRFAFRLQP